MTQVQSDVDRVAHLIFIDDVSTTLQFIPTSNFSTTHPSIWPMLRMPADTPMHY